MSTFQEDKKFIESVISTSLLEDSINWIQSNMCPEDVFTEQQLEDWAKSKGMVFPE